LLLQVLAEAGDVVADGGLRGVVVGCGFDLEGEEGGALIGGLGGFPGTEVEVLPLPAAGGELEGPGVVERGAGDGAEVGLVQVVAGEDDGVQDAFGGVGLVVLPGPLTASESKGIISDQRVTRVLTLVSRAVSVGGMVGSWSCCCSVGRARE